MRIGYAILLGTFLNTTAGKIQEIFFSSVFVVWVKLWFVRFLFKNTVLFCVGQNVYILDECHLVLSKIGTYKHQVIRKTQYFVQSNEIQMNIQLLPLLLMLFFYFLNFQINPFKVYVIKSNGWILLQNILFAFLKQLREFCCLQMIR